MPEHSLPVDMKPAFLTNSQDGEQESYTGTINLSKTFAVSLEVDPKAQCR